MCTVCILYSWHFVQLAFLVKLAWLACMHVGLKIGLVICVPYFWPVLVWPLCCDKGYPRPWGKKKKKKMKGRGPSALDLLGR